nr:hypothetical protein [Mycolicibacterium palauense]
MRPSRATARAVTAAAAGLAALGAPPGPASADQTATDTIELLEYQGYTVNVDRVGNLPLERCVVTSVRNPQTVIGYERVGDGRKHHGHDGTHRGDRGRDDFIVVPVVVSRSISVSLDCTG